MHKLNAGVEIKADRDRVWRALATEPDVKRWLSAEARVELDNRLYSFWGRNIIGVPGPEATRLLAAAANESVELGWHYGDADTKVVLSLHDAGGSTFAMVDHSGLPSRAHEEDAAMHDFWYVALENLRSSVLTGGPVDLPDYAPRVGKELQLSVSVGGEKEAVFACISDPEQLNRYFGRDAVVDLRKGGEISFGWEDGGPQRILELDPPSRLTYSWQFTGEPATVVTWTLEGSGGRTRLTLSHSGFGEESRLDAYGAGWQSFLAIIRSMVELGDQWSMVKVEGVGHGEV
jgi:uncharacterized protein YndB with AHSA1/START domain